LQANGASLSQADLHAIKYQITLILINSVRQGVISSDRMN